MNNNSNSFEKLQKIEHEFRIDKLAVSIPYKQKKFKERELQDLLYKIETHLNVIVYKRGPTKNFKDDLGYFYHFGVIYQSNKTKIQVFSKPFPSQDHYNVAYMATIRITIDGYPSYEEYLKHLDKVLVLEKILNKMGIKYVLGGNNEHCEVALDIKDSNEYVFLKKTLIPKNSNKLNSKTISKERETTYYRRPRSKKEYAIYQFSSGCDDQRNRIESKFKRGSSELNRIKTISEFVKQGSCLLKSILKFYILNECAIVKWQSIFKERKICQNFHTMSQVKLNELTNKPSFEVIRILQKLLKPSGMKYSNIKRIFFSEVHPINKIQQMTNDEESLSELVGEFPCQYYREALVVALSGSLLEEERMPIMLRLELLDYYNKRRPRKIVDEIEMRTFIDSTYKDCKDSVAYPIVIYEARHVFRANRYSNIFSDRACPSLV